MKKQIMKRIIVPAWAKYYLFGSALLLSFLAGCKSPNEPSLKPSNYFPLAVGNKWYYNSYYPASTDTTEINLIMEITGIKVIDNKSYFQAVSFNLTSNLSDTTYYRGNVDTVFYRKSVGRESILADFSLNLNETAYWGPDLKVVLKSPEYMIFESSLGPDAAYVSYKRGVGLIKSVEYGYIFYRRILIKSEIK